MFLKRAHGLKGRPTRHGHIQSMRKDLSERQNTKKMVLKKPLNNKKSTTISKYEAQLTTKTGNRGKQLTWVCPTSTSRAHLLTWNNPRQKAEFREIKLKKKFTQK